MSYFPCDIPYMSKEELEVNGIRIPYDKKQEQPEIIRCGHCKYYEAISNHWGQCRAHNNQTCQICDYCSWAERRTNE